MKYLKYPSDSPFFAKRRKGGLQANTSELDNKKFTFYMTGREFEEQPFIPRKVSEEPVLSVEGLGMNGFFRGCEPFRFTREKSWALQAFWVQVVRSLPCPWFGIQQADTRYHNHRTVTTG